MVTKFCPNQEYIQVTKYDGTVEKILSCNISPDRKRCPYSKQKKAIIKCIDYKRSTTHD